MALIVLVALGLALVTDVRPAFAADQAAKECESMTNDDAAIAACTEVLGRARLPAVARSMAYNNRAASLTQQGKPDAAIADLDMAIQINPRFAGAWFNRHKARLMKGDKAGALADVQVALSLQPPSRSARQALVQVQLHFYIAELQFDLSRFSDAAKNWQAGIAVASKLVNPLDPDLYKAEQNLGRAFDGMNRLDEAEAQYRSLIARVEQIEGRDSPQLARTLDLLGNTLLTRTRIAEAQEVTERSLALYQKSEGPESAGAAEALMDLGTIYDAQNRFDDSLKTIQQAIAIRAKVYGPQSLEAATALENLAAVQEAVGRFRDAEDSALRSLAIVSRIEGSDGSDVGIGLLNLGGIYAQQERTSEAIATQRRALAIFESKLGPQCVPCAKALGNIGNELTYIGLPAEAEPVIARSIAISERNLGPDSPLVAMALNSLARALSALKREDEAIAALNRALSITEKVYGRNSPETSTSLINLAWTELRLGHLDPATELMRRAAGTVLATELPKRKYVETQAEIAVARKNWTEAETYRNEELAIYTRDVGPDYPRSAYVLAKLAWLAEKRNDLDGALALAKRGGAIELKADKATGPSDGYAWAWSNLAVYAWGVAAKHPEQTAALSGEAFGAMQRTQLGTTSAALAQMAARFGAGSSAVSAAVREQQDLTAQAKTLDDKLNNALGAAKQDAGALANLRAQIASVDARQKDATTRIARDFPQYAELSSPQPLTLAQTQALLRSDEALVTWILDDDQTFIFAVTRDGVEWKRTELPEKLLTERVAKLRASLDLDKVTRGLARGDAGRDLVFNLADAHTLYQQLLEPVQTLIGPKTNLIVVPSGALTSLPLQVLVTEPPKRAATSMTDSAYKQAAWLTKSHAVTVLPSVASLRALRAFAKPTSATQPLVGFADPVFGRSPDGKATRGGTTRVADVGSYGRFFRGGTVDVDALRNGLPALPETADELRAVAGALHAPGSDLKFGEDATVGEVKALPLDKFRVVYFATHGLVAGDVRGLTEPALALTIPARPTPADSGLLTASDVAQLKLDADWVVLSACNTASGDKPGADGLSGLARAFFYAGARALLVSHWPVQSAAAVQLTTHAFAAMAADSKLDRAEALRQSELSLIAAGGDNAYPAIWAPFVVVGEGGSGR